MSDKSTLYVSVHGVRLGSDYGQGEFTVRGWVRVKLGLGLGL